MAVLTERLIPTSIRFTQETTRFREFSANLYDHLFMYSTTFPYGQGEVPIQFGAMRLNPATLNQELGIFVGERRLSAGKSLEFVRQGLYAASIGIGEGVDLGNPLVCQLLYPRGNHVLESVMLRNTQPASFAAVTHRWDQSGVPVHHLFVTPETVPLLWCNITRTVENPVGRA